LTNDTPDGLGLTSKSTNGELDAIARGLTTSAASYDPPILADPDEIASELYYWRDELAAGWKGWDHP